MKIVDVEYVGGNRFEFDGVYMGDDAATKYNQATKVVDEKRKNLEIDNNDSVLSGNKAVISLEGKYKNKEDVEQLKSGVDAAFS